MIHHKYQFAVDTSLFPVSEKDHLFEIEYSQIYIYLLLYADFKKHILFRIEMYHFKNDIGYCFFKKRSYLFLKKVVLLAYGNRANIKLYLVLHMKKLAPFTGLV